MITAGGRSSAVGGIVVAVWSWGLAALLLGPALGRGFVLSYDMVWVPDLALRADLLGVGSALPRAVPSDAVVALADEVIPGMLLQKLVLLGLLGLGGVGAARLGPPSLVARLVAVAVFVWNPYVAERLLLGHWPVLLSYAVLPWLVDAVRRWPGPSAPPWRLWWLLPVASLSISGGLAAALLLVSLAARRAPARWAWLVALVGAANAPWMVAGALHASSATTSAAGAAAFGLADEGSVPGPVAALGLGGVWNLEVVPASHLGVLGWAWAAVVVALCGCGVRGWLQCRGRTEVVALAACWAVGWGTAVLTWASPGAVGALGSVVPGAGAVRDGARLLLLCAPVVVALSASGAEAVTRRVPTAAPARPVLGLALALLPVALLPDAALGLSGRLRPAEFPASYDVARGALAHDPHPGDALLLPFTPYRQPAWNHDRKVLDPLGRYLTRDVVASDRLSVSGRSIPGEDPRAAAAGRALALPDPAERAGALAALGIGYVVTERTAAGPSPSVVGTLVVDRSDLLVTRLADPRPRPVATSWWAAMAAAWAVFAGAILAGAVGGAASAHRRLGKDLRPGRHLSADRCGEDAPPS